MRTERYVRGFRSPYTAPVSSVRMQLYIALAGGARLIRPNFGPSIMPEWGWEGVVGGVVQPKL